jgi:hypothetical protein
MKIIAHLKLRIIHQHQYHSPNNKPSLTKAGDKWLLISPQRVASMPIIKEKTQQYMSHLLGFLQQPPEPNLRKTEPQQ